MTEKRLDCGCLVNILDNNQAELLEAVCYEHKYETDDHQSKKDKKPTNRWTTIRIRPKTRDALKDRCRKSESYDEYLNRVLLNSKIILPKWFPK